MGAPRRIVCDVVATIATVTVLGQTLGAPGPVEPTDEEQLVIRQLNRAPRSARVRPVESGRVQVTLRGDQRAVLADLGISDQSGERTVTGIPFIVMLGETGWTGRASLSVTPTSAGGATAVFVRP
jgi:hypothetical protein